MFVYTFHMPAFIIISGYFSRSFDCRPGPAEAADHRRRRPVRRLRDRLRPLQILVASDDRRTISLLDPWYLTWFLCALFIWRLTTPSGG